MINQIIHGDCLEVMPLIPAGTVDMILCDLPYGTTQNEWDSIIPLDILWNEYKRIIKPNGAIILTAQPPFDKVLGTSNLKMLKYEWIWYKSRATGHLNAKMQPLKTHENILVFYKKPPLYNPQSIIKKDVPTIRLGRRGNGTNYGKSDKDSTQEYENYPKSVIYSESEALTLHPTQKPVDLFEYLIRTYTKEGETVLDNCIGSGTTAEASLICGRNFIGIEKELKYVEIARQRIKHIQPTLIL
jgi:site-specific DNA-methyltransferase (adenine-specific)